MERSYTSKITKDHCIELQSQTLPLLFEHPSVKKWKIASNTALWLIIIAFVVIANQGYIIAENSESQLITVGTLLGVLAFAAWFFINYKLQIVLMRACVRESGTTIGDLTHTINSEGLKEAGGNHVFFASWDTFFELVETDNLLVLLTDPFKGVLISKANLSEDEIEELTQFIVEQITKDGEVS